MRVRRVVFSAFALAVLVGCSDQQPVEEPAPSSASSFVSPEEAEQAHLQCMREQGFAAELHPDGGISYDAVPDAQANALLEADERCHALVQVDPRYVEQLDEEQLRRLYGWYVMESIPCLEAEGLAGFSPPSEETFVATYYTEPWTPYFDLEDRLGPGAIGADVRERCPQGPAAEVLFETGGDA